MKITAPAKLNLTLDVLGRRPDGYHEIATVMQAVDLADELTVRRADKPGVRITVGGSRLPLDHRNTVWKAATAFSARTGQNVGLDIHIQKRIPQQAGMGGGSADAAAALVGLNALTGADLSLTELCALAAKVGADVPFCVMGGAAMATGTGTALSPLTPLADCAIVVAKPPVGVSTAAAYIAIDSAAWLVPADQAGMRQALAAGDPAAVGSLLHNAFEQALALPQVTALLEEMEAFSPLGCRMTGSGSAVFALFADEDAAARCAETLRRECEQVFICRPCTHGPQIIA